MEVRRNEEITISIREILNKFGIKVKGCVSAIHFDGKHVEYDGSNNLSEKEMLIVTSVRSPE